MKRERGFTLIELLVVIAIIGILSSVVLASLTTARTRGTAAAIQNEMSNMRAQAELYYSTNSNTYGTATDCTSGVFNGTNGLQNLRSGVTAKGGTVECASTGSAWAAQASYNSTYYCVDSTGVSTTSANDLITATNDSAC
ncbi:MAG: type II secretion system protein [Candidatus Taylorbacteria bacterium]|nr:type II secretion system protein [Candidatus Taylorbacteria bacterium]